jgi:hypothetical protein
LNAFDRRFFRTCGQFVYGARLRGAEILIERSSADDAGRGKRGIAMRLVPKSKAPQIQFFETHVPKWAAAPEQIGTTAAEVAALADSTAIARAAYREQYAAIQAARSATVKLNQALADMKTRGAAIIHQIRGKATLASDNSVYVLASISPPDAPSKIAKPGTPYRFEFSLDAIGALRLKWQCKNPRGSVGTMYRVSRQLGGVGEFVFLGVTGTKRFVDQTVPAGVRSVMYEIRAMRTTGVGDVATFNVNFGTSGRLHSAMRFMGDDRQAA